MLKITSIILVLGLLFGGTGAAVVAAQDSLPGEALYTIKTTSEDIQLKLIPSDAKRLEKALEFVNNRVVEVAIKEGEGKVWTEDALTDLTDQLEKNLKDALLAAAAMDDPATGLTAIEDQIKVLAIAIQKRPQDQTSKGDRGDGSMVMKMLRKAYDLVLTGIEAPLDFSQTISGLYGHDLENLDLLATASDGEILNIESGSGAGEWQNQSNQADQGQSSQAPHGTGQDAPQAEPNQNNAGASKSNRNAGSGSTYGYGPANEDGNDPNQNQAGENQ
jgi:hypothetical protein